MQLTYEDKRLKEIIEDNNYGYAIKKIGLDMTKAFKKRILQIKAADNFSIYISTGLGKPHILHGDLYGCYGLNITGNYRLIVKPEVNAYDKDSLLKCDIVLVKGVTDYHDGKYKWILP